MANCYSSIVYDVFSLAGTDLAAIRVSNRLFSRLEKIYSPGEIKPPEWNLSLVPRSLTHTPYDPVKLSLDKCLTLKACLLLALVSVRKVSELHRLSSRVRHSTGWKSCTFSFVPGFVAKTQNPLIRDFRIKEFTIPSLMEFMV